jgi:flagellar basal-body rod protein FlgG
MNLSLYSAATGMDAQQLNLNTIANNLANVNTPGFKRSTIQFQDLLYQKPRNAGAESGGGDVVPTGIEVGNGTRVASTTKIFTQGQLTNSGQQLDLAIQGDGFYEVQKPDGTVAYTRDGSFKLNSSGQVVTTDGRPVLGGFQNVPAGTTSINVSESGMVSYQTASGTTTFNLTLSRFANPSGLMSLGGNLYAATSASGTAETGSPGEQGFGGIMQGYVETSNVNIVEEMVSLIVAQRAYEVNSKSIQASDEMLQNVNQLKR